MEAQSGEVTSLRLLQVELYPPRQMFKPLVPMNVILLGNRVLGDIIKMQVKNSSYWSREGL